MLNNNLDFYSIGAIIVKGWSPVYDSNDKEIECLRPNTFAVLKSSSSVDSDNLMKNINYQDKQFFYSRKWEDKGKSSDTLSFDYPLIGVAQDNFMFANFRKQSTKNITFNLMVLDKMPGNFKDGNYCDARTWEEAGNDVELIMSKFLTVLKDFVFAEITKDGETFFGWYTKNWIETNKPSFDFCEIKSDFSDNIVSDALEGEVFYHVFNDDLLGCFLNITITFNGCELIEIKQDLADVQLRYSDGCKEC